METNKKGFTLLEMLLVLVIIVSIILIAMRYYSQASESSKTSDLTSKIRRITEASYEWVKVTKNFKQKDPNQNELSIEALQKMNLLTPNDAKNPWGGNISLGARSFDSIVIMAERIPTKACLVISDNLTPQNMEVVCNPDKPGLATLYIAYPDPRTTS